MKYKYAMLNLLRTKQQRSMNNYYKKRMTNWNYHEDKLFTAYRLVKSTWVQNWK